jgi:hypothetical protein
VTKRAAEAASLVVEISGIEHDQSTMTSTWSHVAFLAVVFVG